MLRLRCDARQFRAMGMHLREAATSLAGFSTTSRHHHSIKPSSYHWPGETPWDALPRA